MGELSFVDALPPAGASKSKTRARAAELRAHPGKWAMWPSKAAGSAVRRSLTAIGPGYEVEMRGPRAYARYVGSGDGRTPPRSCTTSRGDDRGHRRRPSDDHLSGVQLAGRHPGRRGPAAGAGAPRQGQAGVRRHPQKAALR